MRLNQRWPQQLATVKTYVPNTFFDKYHSHQLFSLHISINAFHLFKSIEGIVERYNITYLFQGSDSHRIVIAAEWKVDCQDSQVLWHVYVIFLSLYQLTYYLVIFAIFTYNHSYKHHILRPKSKYEVSILWSPLLQGVVNLPPSPPAVQCSVCKAWRAWNSRGRRHNCHTETHLLQVPLVDCLLFSLSLQDCWRCKK